MDPRKGLRPKVSLIKADDLERATPNRREKRRLLKALRRLPAPRTGRPRPLQRATGSPDHFTNWMRDGLSRELRARGINAVRTIDGNLSIEPTEETA